MVVHVLVACLRVSLVGQLGPNMTSPGLQEAVNDMRRRVQAAMALDLKLSNKKGSYKLKILKMDPQKRRFANL